MEEKLKMYLWLVCVLLIQFCNGLQNEGNSYTYTPLVVRSGLLNVRNLRGCLTGTGTPQVDISKAHDMWYPR